MTSNLNTDSDENFEQFPDNPEVALFIANAFKQLGAQFIIGHNEARSVSIPLCTRFNGGLPHLHEARLHERFSGDVEYRGAMKLMGYFVSRFSDADLDHVFAKLASVKSLPDSDFDYRTNLSSNEGGIS